MAKHVYEELEVYEHGDLSIYNVIITKPLEECKEV